ncbi:hypothetical protein FRC12_021695 [Ceratobasidium sp. 428]|nr:hypothetical protein FRC12_021695 [Ceratobasidium sp. 428]
MVQFQDTNRVLAFVLEVVSRFLDKNNLLNQPRHVDNSQGSPHKRARRGDSYPSSMDSQRLRVASASNMQSQTPPRNLTNHLIAGNSPSTNEPLATFDDSGYFEWTDPSSGESFLVDSNTGNSFSGNHLSSCIYEDAKDSARDDAHKNAEPSFFDRRSLKPSVLSLELEAKKSNKIPEWLTKAMRVSNS